MEGLGASSQTSDFDLCETSIRQLTFKHLQHLRITALKTRHIIQPITKPILSKLGAYYSVYRTYILPLYNIAHSCRPKHPKKGCLEAVA
jgi:hypothetical protein